MKAIPNFVQISYIMNICTELKRIPRKEVNLKHVLASNNIQQNMILEIKIKKSKLY